LTIEFDLGIRKALGQTFLVGSEESVVTQIDPLQTGERALGGAERTQLGGQLGEEVVSRVEDSEAREGA
jgi:hypothetical protein